MSVNLKIQKVLKETEVLLQDIECELHFRLPHSKKSADIRNMVLWLKGVDPIATFDFSFQEQNQLEALAELLPELKGELHLAEYQKTYKANLFERIDEQYQALKALKSMPDSTFDPFYYDIEQPIEALQDYKFAEEIFHSDDMGHCQVQLLSADQPYDLENILDQIDRHQDWNLCFSMLKQQPVLWLLHFSEALKNNKNYHTLCQIKLLDLIDERDCLITIVQNADSWYWSHENKRMIPGVLKKIEVLLNHDYCDELNKEIELNILHTVKAKLAVPRI